MKRHLLVLLILPNMLIAKSFNPEFDQFSGPVRRMIGEALDRYNQTNELAKSRSEEKPKVVAPVSTPKPTAPVAPKDSNTSGFRFALVPQQSASSAATTAVPGTQSPQSGVNNSGLGVVTKAVASTTAGVSSAPSSNPSQMLDKHDSLIGGVSVQNPSAKPGVNNGGLGVVTKAVAAESLKANAGITSTPTGLQSLQASTADVSTTKNSQFLEEPKEDKLTSGASSSSISRGQRPSVKPVVKKSPWDIFKICGCR